MGKKKPFINKKNAQHFHVVHRSQRDPKANDPEASKYVLLSSTQQVEFRSDGEESDDDDFSDDDMPDLVDSPRAGASTQPRVLQKAQSKQKSKAFFPTRKVRFGNVEAEDLVDEHGMVRDGYDYSQHMKEMGQGKFYSADGQFQNQSVLAKRVELPEDVLPSVEEQDRLLDAITLTTEVMDSDLREALVNDEAFEELDDDFVLQAANGNEDDANDGFDYDAHIAKLMEAASGVPKFRGNLSDDEEKDEYDSEYSDEEEELDDADKEEEQRALDALFEKTLAEEYDDDQLGELEDDDPETRGELLLEGELLNAIVDDFVQVRQEIMDDEGKLGNPLRTGNRLKQILEECEAERALDEENEEEDPVVEEDPEVERELQCMFERNAYLASREQEQWDCETIVSTYSNLDNHPTVLREEPLNKRKKKKKSAASDSSSDTSSVSNNKSQILLSRKTGMPLGVFEVPKKVHETSQTAASVMHIQPKKKDETKEEKKLRKEAVRLLKSQRRQEKKQWKTAFKEEEQRQSTQTVGGKVSVFKY